MVVHPFKSQHPEDPAEEFLSSRPAWSRTGKATQGKPPSSGGGGGGRNSGSQGRSYGSKVQRLPLAERLWVSLSKNKSKKKLTQGQRRGGEKGVTGPEPWAKNPEVPASCEGQSVVSSQHRGSELPEECTSSGLVQRLGSMLLL